MEALQIRQKPTLSSFVLSGMALSGLLLALGATRGFAAGETAAPQDVTPQQAAFFETKVRPLLYEKCFPCHGEKLQSATLRLDSRAAILKGTASGPAAVPGDPAKSRLIQAVHYDGETKMPPAGKLKPDEIATLTEWVQMGLPWPGAKMTAVTAANATDYVIKPEQKNFWSFRPVRKPAPPKVLNKAWVKSPLDAFVLAKLEAKGLTPAPPADRRTLIRRVYFDLIGLPPTPQQVEAFLKDKSPNAYAKVVDGLLASPHYGERWGRHWLDVARYADSNGQDENLAFGNAYRYRDYVVAAFNKDKPYNQFICEQLAGDLMPTADENVRNERLTATGFLCLGPKVLAEQDKPKLVMDIVDEQIDVTSKAFLGLTVACARCHNHKFDPIPTKDYYALAGIFKSTKAMQNLDFVSRVNERPLLTKALQADIADHEKQTVAARAILKGITDKANAALLADLHANGDKYLRAGWTLTKQPPLHSIAETPARPGDPARIVLEAVSANRTNLFRDTSNYGKGIGVLINTQTPDFAEWDVEVPTAGTYQIEFRYASGEQRPVRLLLNGKRLREDAAGNSTGSFYPDGQKWEVQGLYAFRAGKNVLRIERDSYVPHLNKILIVPAAAVVPPGTSAPRTLDELVEADGLNPALVRYFAGRLHDVASLDAARVLLTDAKDKEGKPGLLALPEKPETVYPEPAQSEAMKAQKAMAAAEAATPKPPLTLAVEEGKIEDVKVHIRGSTLNLGEVAPRRFLMVLGGDQMTPIDDKRSGRLELAQWLTRPDHPLTARVAVNRIWQGHFGDALMRTPDNWGKLGDRPVQAALIDWLAATFVEDSWSFKKMHRRILLSSTYQMGSANNPKAQLVDPDNRLIWRMNLQRLDAESFRDAMLAVSGKLDTSMGGTLLTTGDNDYVTNDQSANAANYSAPRRSLYLPVIRNALFDEFQAFDFADPNITHAQRASTTVAPQALYVMNSPFVADVSQKLAGDVLAAPAKSDAERVQLAYQRVLDRSPTPPETARALGYLARYSTRLAATQPDAQKRRVTTWKSFCQILFATNEFIYLN